VKLCLILSLLLTVPCWSQTTGKANASGPCSLANTGDKNNLTINCGIGKQQGKEMLAILNRILKDQLDPNTVMNKLNEISSGVKDIQRRTSDRVLSDAQTAALALSLSKSPQSINAVLLGDREANAYGQQIIQALRRAGWNVSISRIVVMSPPTYGVVVANNDALRAALGAVGVEVSTGRTPFNATILIGLKPY
jgi:hypothetical protein